MGRSTRILFQLLAAITVICLAPTLWAQEPYLIKDLEQVRVNPFESSTRAAISDNLIVFAGEDPAHGDEVWVSDGTASGTKLLRDINPGSEGSSIGEMVAVPLSGGGARVVFTASSPNEGHELWESDGSVAGTRLVSDIEPGPDSSFPTELTPLGTDRVAINVFQSSTFGSEIFIYDIVANTVTPRELVAGTGASSVQNLSYIGGDNALYFTGFTGPLGHELYRLNLGTDVISLVADICAGASSSFPGKVTKDSTFNQNRYFTAIDCSGGNGRELFKTTGAPPSGAVLVKDINPGSGSSFPDTTGVVFTPFGSAMLFAANDGSSGFEPWVTDGTLAGTKQLADVLPGSASSIEFPGRTPFFVSSNSAVFVARSSSLGSELWRTLGTPETTEPLLDIRPGSESSLPDNLVSLPSGEIVLSADDGSTGKELWITNGLSSGTVQIKDINSGPIGSAIFGNALGSSDGFFSAISGDMNQLYRTDGTSGGTAVFASKSDPAASFGSDIEECTPFGDRVILDLATLLTGEEAWISDGTEAGTQILKDIFPGETGSSASTFVRLGDKLLFRAADDLHGSELWSSDGTEANTTLLSDINPGSESSSPSDLITLGDKVLFSANDGSSGTELWRADGTVGGTMLLKDIEFGTGSSLPGGFAALGTKAAFTARDSAHGTELWITDGTTGGTSLVKDIKVGNQDSISGSLISLGDKIIFAADDGINGSQLWVSDGTSSGTQPLTSAPFGLFTQDFAVVNNTALLNIFDGSIGSELWISDGTASGTHLVKELIDGPDGSDPFGLTTFGTRVIFSARTDSAGRELWISDGTESGTELVKDINPGNPDSNPSFFIEDSGFAYFVADDGETGSELWRTDGTESGTVPLSEIVPGTESSDAFLLCKNNGIIYLSASMPETGQELFGLVVDACPTDSNKTEAGVCGCGSADTDLNANGIIDCLVNQELINKLQTVRSLVNKIKPAGTLLTKKGKAARTSLKKLKKEVKLFFTSNQDKIVVSNTNQTSSKLHSAVQKGIKKVLKGDPLTFQQDKKAAKKALKKFITALS